MDALRSGPGLFPRLDRGAGGSELTGGIARGQITRLSRRLWREDAGQAITEYILLLSFVTVGSVAIARAILAILDQITMQFGGQLEQDIKTGRAPVNVFRN